MALLSILEFPDPRLRTRAEPVRAFDAALRKLIADMFQTMYAAPGIGLAATQVDVHRALLIMDASHDKNQPQVYINPEILLRDGVEVSEEGCLSVPSVFEEVQRAARVRVRAQNAEGKVFERELENLDAVCLQHEMDHLAGAREVALQALPVLAAWPHELVGVLTQVERQAGRGAAGRPRELKASPVKRLAGELGLSLAQPARLKSEDERAPLLRWASDLLVVVAYGLLLPRAVLELPRLGCLNIHASLLPRWRGAAPIQRAILAGDRETGVTIMQMDEGLDTGAMLAQRRLAVGDHA